MLDAFKKMKNVSCEYDWLNGWNSTLQATWYIRHARSLGVFILYFEVIILRSIEKRLLWARPIGGWNSTLRAAYSIIRLYRAHAINRSFSPFFSAQTFAPILYVRTRTDCCLLLFLNMSSYEYYWCCWCCCAYRVVPYDPSLVVASFVASLSRSYCWAEPSNG